MFHATCLLIFASILIVVSISIWVFVLALFMFLTVSISESLLFDVCFLLSVTVHYYLYVLRFVSSCFLLLVIVLFLVLPILSRYRIICLPTFPTVSHHPHEFQRFSFFFF